MCACGVRQLVAAGADVVAGSRDPEKAGRGEIPAGVRLVKCDVRDQKALAEALAAEAPYDILISSATGGDRAIGPFMTMDMAGFQASFDKLWGYTNIVVRTAPLAVPPTASPTASPQRPFHPPPRLPSTHPASRQRYGGEHVREGGSITLVSGSPARKPKPGQVALASVGASVEQFVRTLAVELAPKKVSPPCRTLALTHGERRLLGVRATASWPWVPAWGSLETWSKKCEGA